MGKRNFAKLLVAVPLTASIIVNPATVLEKEDLKEQTSEKTEYYSVEEKFKKIELDKISFEVKDGFWEQKNSKGKGGNEIKISEIDSKTAETEIISVEEKERRKEKEYFGKIENMVGKYPMAKMLPYLEKQDPITAAFLVAIAKKESNWGKVSPRSKDGDCFNYWGFKDRRFKFVAGHSCFPSAEVAVETVGKRIDNLVAKGKNTPSKMVIWKCGSACASDKGAGKWISDVNLYFGPIISSVSL